MSTISELNNLIEKRKGKIAETNPRIAQINKRTVRVIRDEENFITKTGEFNFSNGKPVKAEIPYHIHYTSALEEVYMTEYEHKPKLSKIIYPTDIKTNFQYYNNLNKQSSLKLEGERVQPTDIDYSNGSYVRYFAKQANDERAPTFEISKEKMMNSSLYIYVRLTWYLSGEETKVYIKNSREIIKASKTIPNIGKILSKMQYYRYDRSLDPKESIKERLGIRGTTTTETFKESKTFEETHGESNGGAY